MRSLNDDRLKVTVGVRITNNLHTVKYASTASYKDCLII